MAAVSQAPPAGKAGKGGVLVSGSGSGSGSGRLEAGLGDDFNARAIRHALRVFVVGVLGLKGWEVISRKIFGREQK